MNYLTLSAYGQNTGQKAGNSSPYNIIGPQKIFLTCKLISNVSDQHGSCCRF